MPDPEIDLNAAAEHAVSCGRAWGGAAKAPVRRSTGYHSRKYLGESWERAYLRQLSGEKEQEACQPVEGADPLHCHQCNKPFNSRKAIAMHMFKSHGCKAQARLFATNGTCKICLKHFHNRPRLLYHLSYSAPSCFSKLLHIGTPLTIEEADNLDEIDAQSVRKDRKKGIGLRRAWLPALRLQGPLQHIKVPTSEDPGHCVPCGGINGPLHFYMCKGRQPADAPELEVNKMQALARSLIRKIQAGGAEAPAPVHWPRPSVDVIYRERAAQRRQSDELLAESFSEQGAPAPESAGSQCNETVGASTGQVPLLIPSPDRENGQGPGSGQDPRSAVCGSSPTGELPQNLDQAPLQCDPAQETPGQSVPALTPQQLERIRLNRLQAVKRQAAAATQVICPKRYDPALDARVDSLAVITTELVILHLVSGHRRNGDIQCQIEQSAFVGRFCVFMLSIDIALSTGCNVSKQQNRNFW